MSGCCADRKASKEMSRVYELGETAVVRAIIRNLDIEFEDCAVIDLTDTEYLVATTDMFHRATDFPEEMSAWQIGWMSAAGTLSDVAAMGARPCGLLISMGLPNLEPAFVESMIEGMNACARKCGTAIIGGDTDAHQELTITGTALGRVRKDQILRRRGAQIRDLVCVTGHLGTAGAGMRALELGLAADDPVAVKKLFEPVPRIAEGIRLVLRYRSINWQR
jgi:thiamine-monophosphate kinase